MSHSQVCGKPVTTNSGKSLRPPDNARIILYLKDVNLPRPDKYQVSPLPLRWRSAPAFIPLT